MSGKAPNLWSPEMTQEEAQEILDKFSKAYPSVQQHKKAQEDAKRSLREKALHEDGGTPAASSGEGPAGNAPGSTQKGAG
jgi:hypothetical protein